QLRCDLPKCPITISQKHWICCPRQHHAGVVSRLQNAVPQLLQLLDLCEAFVVCRFLLQVFRRCLFFFSLPIPLRFRRILDFRLFWHGRSFRHLFHPLNQVG